MNSRNSRLVGLVPVLMAALLGDRRVLAAKDEKAEVQHTGGASNAGIPKLTDAEQEEFLAKAKIFKTRAASKGITGTQRATLTDGKITHDAHIQCIDESKYEFKTDRGTELNFRDSYKFNIAAYRLDRLLGLGNVPVTVERKVAGKPCAVDWWVDEVMMDEAKRKQKKFESPDAEAWNQSMYVVRIFDQLIYNVDRNLQNLLILKNWDIVMIDHSRSFRLQHTLPNDKNLVMCDRTLLASLRALDKEQAQQRLTPYLTKGEVEALLARRDLIVKFFEGKIKEKGEAAVLYDLPKTAKGGQGPNF
jgi:hypothetical protein